VTLALLAPAQDILPGVEQTVEIFVASRVLGKATVVVGDEAGQKRVCRLDVLMPASLNSFTRLLQAGFVHRMLWNIACGIQ
jgi:hypothetical protein